MRREDDRRLVTEVLIESGDRMQLRILDPDAGPPGLLDLLAHHAHDGDQVTLVHVGNTWTASTLSHEWPFGPDLADNLLADRNPTVVERAESRVLQLGAAGNFAMVTGTGGSRHHLPRWIFSVGRRPASLVVGRVTRDRGLRLAAFSRSRQFLARVADSVDGDEAEVPADILSRRVPARSTVYRFAFAVPPLRRERLELDPSEQPDRPDLPDWSHRPGRPDLPGAELARRDRGSSGDRRRRRDRHDGAGE
ncbi:MAG: hypothetical protein ACRDYZ_07540 [Acidimicrobiales bacterium]